MYNYESDFLLLDDKNDMLPKKNLFITFGCCFIFYNILLCDIYMVEKYLIFKLVQILLWFINFLSLIALINVDPGIATKRIGTSKNAIHFLDENVIYSRKMLAINGCDFDDEKFCEKCSILKKGTISHCRFCDICLQDRDHHCAWFNRCIAAGNLKIFRNFLISSTISAMILVFDILRLFTNGSMKDTNFLDMAIIMMILFACMGLFVLTGLLTLQYLISAILDIKTRKLISGQWEWKSTRCFKWMREEKVTVENFDEKNEL
ncbi:DHHC-type Zn-finger protein [Pseudoloma neurophilia]|uniref:Palmitoyltransferase n=1 Tax=Pseudoloma neurophilia TaxID=146866 RepID=A0A0R0LSE8_9MICR|nr:DHHC-type Zn-finger protein [Pseudoloma neurophilia]